MLPRYKMARSVLLSLTTILGLVQSHPLSPSSVDPAQNVTTADLDFDTNLQLGISAFQGSHPSSSLCRITAVATATGRYVNTVSSLQRIILVFEAEGGVWQAPSDPEQWGSWETPQRLRSGEVEAKCFAVGDMRVKVADAFETAVQAGETGQRLTCGVEIRVDEGPRGFGSGALLYSFQLRGERVAIDAATGRVTDVWPQGGASVGELAKNGTEIPSQGSQMLER